MGLKNNVLAKETKDMKTRNTRSKPLTWKERLFLHGVTLSLTTMAFCEKAFAFKSGTTAGEIFNSFDKVVSSQATPIVLAGGLATSLYYAVVQQKFQPVMIGAGALVFFTAAKTWIGTDYALVM